MNDGSRRGRNTHLRFMTSCRSHRLALLVQANERAYVGLQPIHLGIVLCHSDPKLRLSERGIATVSRGQRTSAAALSPHMMVDMLSTLTDGYHRR